MENDAPMKMVRRQSRRNPSRWFLESIEETLQAFFSDRPEVVLAYLFGSYLDRATRAFHDIDIAVFAITRRVKALDRATPYGYEAHLNSKLARILKYDPVDVVLLNHAPPLLLRQVISKGKLIFCRSEADRICFEVASLKRHADTIGIRRIKRFYMKQRIEKGLDAYA